MGKAPRQRYTDEFKDEAVKLFNDSDLTIGDVSKRLGVPKSTLLYWVEKRSDSSGSSKAKKSSKVSDLEAENSRLRKELAEARMERDILKKAAAFFAKESGRGSRS